MVFIKRVKRGKKTYYYLVESEREGKTVKHRTIRRLSPEEAVDPSFLEQVRGISKTEKTFDWKTIILAAGKATRLYPATISKPKCLLEVGNTTIIDHTVENLGRCGIYDLVVVTGFGERQIKNHLLKRARYIHNPFFATTNILVSAWIAREELQGNCLLIYGDLVFDRKIIQQVMERNEDICVVMAVGEVDDESEKILAEQSKVVQISKEVPISEASGEFAGIVKLSQEGCEYLRIALEEIIREDHFANLYLTAVLERLIEEGHEIAILPTNSLPYMEIDTSRDLRKAREVIMPRILLDST